MTSERPGLPPALRAQLASGYTPVRPLPPPVDSDALGGAVRSRQRSSLRRPSSSCAWTPPRLGWGGSWGVSLAQVVLGLGLVVAALKEAVPGRGWSRPAAVLWLALPLLLIVGVTYASWDLSPIRIRGQMVPGERNVSGGIDGECTAGGGAGQRSVGARVSNAAATGRGPSGPWRRLDGRCGLAIVLPFLRTRARADRSRCQRARLHDVGSDSRAPPLALKISAGPHQSSQRRVRVCGRLRDPCPFSLELAGRESRTTERGGLNQEHPLHEPVDAGENHGDRSGKGDSLRPLRASVSERDERPGHDHHDDQLSDFDAKVEREQRPAERGARQPELLEHRREAEAVNQAERCRQPRADVGGLAGGSAFRAGPAGCRRQRR